jgi:chromate transporter
LQLFWSFFQVGLFTFGGGLAALPLVQNQVVDLHQWLTMAEFADVVTISEMTPGPISINAATFIGTKLAGIGGALVATFGFVLPSFIFVSILAWIIVKFKDMKALKRVLSGLRPASVALIASAGLTILILTVWGTEGFSLNIAGINFVAVILFAAALFVLRWKKPNPIIVMLCAGLIGGAVYLFV